MLRSCLRSWTASVRIGGVLSIALVTLLVGCRSTGPVAPSPAPGAAPDGPFQQRVIILVHGDASYLYHDPAGTGHEADAETLREAVTAARSLPSAEVFLFHQRPQDRLLGLFPRDDGTFYHFRGGQLVARRTYEQTRSTPFEAEARLVQAHRAPSGDSLFTAALYYGHAVPDRARPGYHRSRPTVPFGISDLAAGFDRLRGPTASTFDAVILSTCNGGTPPTVQALAPHARHLLASPGTLHLSFIDADLLGAVGAPSDAGAWLDRIADRAFNRLTERTTTPVTLSTYDLSRAAPTARRLARAVPPDTSTAPAGGRHVDCQTSLPSLTDTTGVRTWDRPARFGPQADRPAHSGWGCLAPNSSRSPRASE